MLYCHSKTPKVEQNVAWAKNKREVIQSVFKYSYV